MTAKLIFTKAQLRAAADTASETGAVITLTGPDGSTATITPPSADGTTAPKDRKKKSLQDFMKG